MAYELLTDFLRFIAAHYMRHLADETTTASKKTLVRQGLFCLRASVMLGASWSRPVPHLPNWAQLQHPAPSLIMPHAMYAYDAPCQPCPADCKPGKHITWIVNTQINAAEANGDE